MSKCSKLVFICLLSFLFIYGCSNNSSGSSSTNGNNAAFSRSPVGVTLGSSTDLILAITGGTAQGVVFTLNSSNQNIIKVSPPNCQLSASPGSPQSCQLTIFGIATGTAILTATAPGFNQVSTLVTVQTTPIPGVLVFNPVSENVGSGSNNSATLSLIGSSGVSIVAAITSSNPGVLTTTPTSCNLASGAANSCEISLNAQSSGNAIVTATSGSYTAKLAATVNSGHQNGTIAFDRTAVTLAPNTFTTDQISINNSSGIVNDVVTLASSNSSVAVVAPSTCTLSSAVNLKRCMVYIKGLTNGTANITATSIYNGYTYSITPVTVGVNTSGFNFSTQVSGISQTIYAGQNYNAQFTFTNNSGAPVTLGNMVITNSGYPLNIQLDPTPCSNITLQNGGICTIVGSNISLPANGQLSQLNFVLNSTSGASYTFSMNFTAVINYPNYAAFRLINHLNPGHNAWLVALGNAGSGQAVVQFNGLGQGALLPQSDSYAQGQIAIPATPLGLVVYQPNYQGGAGNGIGGLMYVSLDTPVFESAGNIGVSPTNPNDPNVNVNYSVYEPNVYNNSSNKFLANLDVTAINFYGVMQGFYATDINTGINRNPGFLLPMYNQLPTTTIYSQIQSSLTSAWPNNWGSPSQFVFDTIIPTQWVGLKGLVNYIGQNPSVYPTGFNPNTYTQYVADLWTYYAIPGNSILIDAGEITSGCILQAKVNSATTMLVQPQTPGTCPESSSTGLNTFTWTTFQPVDFVGGAPGSWSTLYGPNGTYQSMGKYVSAAQSVGFLPYCSNTSFVYGPTAFKNPANQANYWNAQYTCLANYSTYGGSVMNQYDKIIHQYVPLIYGWAYDDALGISSEVDIDPTTSVFTLVLQQFNP